MVVFGGVDIIYLPGTQMSLVLIGKDLLLETKQRTNGFQVLGGSSQDLQVVVITMVSFRPLSIGQRGTPSLHGHSWCVNGGDPNYWTKS